MNEERLSLRPPLMDIIEYPTAVYGAL